jgi:hypothetical protein
MEIDYDKFVLEEKERISKEQSVGFDIKTKKLKFQDITEGYDFISRMMYNEFPSKLIWFISSLVFLNNPKNKKYVKLLILLFEYNDKSIYETCNEIYNKFTKENKDYYGFYDELAITSFRHNSKVYELIEELQKRLLLIKINGDFEINQDLFGFCIEYYTKCEGASDLYDMFREDKSKSKIFSAMNYEVFDCIIYDKESVNEIFKLFKLIKINSWKKLFTLKKFNFNSFYTTLYLFVHELILVFDNIDSYNINKLIHGSVFNWEKINKIELKEIIKKIDISLFKEYGMFMQKVITNNVLMNNYMDKGMTTSFPDDLTDKIKSKTNISDI